jgi:hypothetical protein
MKLGTWLGNNYKDTLELVESGYAGAKSARNRVLHDEPVGSAMARGARNSWKAAAIGACAGIVGVLVASDRKSSRKALLGGLAGGCIGLGGSMAWGSREVIGAMASEARRKVSTARDAQWLERHPINYA